MVAGASVLLAWPAVDVAAAAVVASDALVISKKIEKRFGSEKTTEKANEKTTT